MKDQLYQILSICAIVIFFVPIMIVSLRKLWKEKALILFACYWTVGGLINLVDILPGISKRDIEITGVVYNMLDVPFFLTIVYFTTFSHHIKKFVIVVLPLFFIMAAASLFMNGLHYEALTYVLGAGILLAVTVIIWSIGWYLKKIEYSYREKSMLFIYAALLFSDGTFIVVYIFDYFINKSGSKDNFLVYYISCIISIAIASYGFLVKPSAEEVEISSFLSSPYN